MKTIIASGFGVECVSIGEVLLALRLGARKILYTSVSVALEEWDAVLKLSEKHAAAGSCLIWINCDSISRLQKVPVGSSIPLWMRINGSVGAGHHSHVITCGPDSKFGVPHEHLPAALAVVHERQLQLVGLHQHIGSGVLDAHTYLAAVDVLASLVEQYAAQLPHLQYVDFGGGLGVPYKPGQAALDLPSLSASLSTRFDSLKAKTGRDGLQLVLEPGRYPVAEAGYLVCRVNTVKETPPSYGGKTWVGVDTGFNHLIRPCMYGSYHRISVLGVSAAEADEAQAGGHEYMVAGNICETGDVFTPDGPRSFPRALAEGDLLAFHTVGAYGYAMASEYNLRPRPAEVLLLPGEAGGERRVHVARPALTAEELVDGILQGYE